MKKILLSSVASVFALAMTVTPALAGHKQSGNDGSSCCSSNRESSKCCPSVKVDNFNGARVDNTIVSVANTGANYISPVADNIEPKSLGYKKGHGDSDKAEAPKIETGDAYANGKVVNKVGKSVTKVEAPDQGSVDVSNANLASVDNEVIVVANTGFNASSGGTIETGDAYAKGKAVNLVGSNVTIISGGHSNNH